MTISSYEHRTLTVLRKDADRTAKGCLPLTAFPVAAWRLDGRHRAIIGSISTRWSVRTSSRREPCFDQEALLSAYNRDQTLPEVAQRFESLMKGKGNDASLISGSLLQACQQVHPAQSQVRDHQQVDRMQLVRGPITNMWRIWRDMRAVHEVTLRSILRVWRLRVKFRAQKKAVEKASREQRKQRVHGLLAQAEEADRAHNARGLYSIVRKLAPKQRFKPLQVKTEKGICLSGREEVAELKRLFGGVFCGTPEVSAPPWRPLQRHCTSYQRIKLSRTAVRRHLYGRHVLLLWRRTYTPRLRPCVVSGSRWCPVNGKMDGWF